MNTLFVLLDGAEDHPLPQLGGRKPLEVARMPYRESRAPHRYSTDGRPYTHKYLVELMTGSPPRSPRGALEALGLGMDVSSGRVAYRLSPALLNNSCIEWAYCIDERVPDLMEAVEDNMELIEHMSPELNFFLKGRAVLTLDCEQVFDLPGPPTPARMKRFEGSLGDLVCEVAGTLDGLTVLPWGGGRLESEGALATGLVPLTTVSNSPTALGVTRALGQKGIHVDEMEDRFPLAADLLEKGNVLLHVDETDEYSHQRRVDAKVEVLEESDRLMAEYFPSAERVVYLVDHGTSCITGEHLPIQVPVWSSFELSAAPGEHLALAKLLPAIFPR